MARLGHVREANEHPSPALPDLAALHSTRYVTLSRLLPALLSRSESPLCPLLYILLHDLTTRRRLWISRLLLHSAHRDTSL